LQNVKVLAIDQQAGTDEKQEKPTIAKAVTLEVSTEDAQKLSLASSIGSLSLALRNYSSPDAVTPRTLSIDDLFPTAVKTEAMQKTATPIASKAEVSKHSLEIIRGTDATFYDVADDGIVAYADTPPGSPKPPAKPRKPLK
jgi:Flp pilus assembly protein CpaB